MEASCSIFVPTITWDKPFNTESYPQASIVRYEFPEREGMPPLELTWYDGGLMPRRPAELEPGRQLGDKLGGVIFVGDKGKLICGSYGNSPRLIPESRMKDYKRPDAEHPALGRAITRNGSRPARAASPPARTSTTPAR